MWVQLKTVKNIEVQGKMRTYAPGDWVEVGKQLALRWVANGDAWVPEVSIADFMDITTTGIVVTGDEEVGRRLLEPFRRRVGIAYTYPELRWPKTLLWDPAVALRTELLPIGFHLLDAWQVACPLLSYDTLAQEVGNEEDQERTRALIHDLRVPVYDVRLVFVRRCGDTRLLMEYWGEERAGSVGTFHPFLRAMYRARPLVLALPVTWVDRGAVKEDA
jgi:hypothetical protein